ncbi:hypothetical protein BCON_0285g00140 [Botryotinia convoluta]|uniref:Uncharacterized protein n=1 Tax=Botryotinia convoluta TaxID=54673 RepID=A0A4Z1HE94_9HELO|nr:hypothetical protein BCON_0285g00140 [Botryotinia convoluta]
MADRHHRHSNSSSDEKKSRRSAGSNEAQYKGSSRENTSSDDSKRPSRSSGNTTHSGFSTFSQTPNIDLYGSSTNPPTNPPSAKTYRATQGVPQNPILYGEYENRTSTSTYPTNPGAHRDDYRDAVASRVPDESPMKKLNDKYKEADDNAERTKEDYKSYRQKYAASDSEMKTEKKAKVPDYQRKYRGVPAGTKQFHENAIPKVESAIYWANKTEKLRTEMATSYVATERSKKSADGHKKRATQMSQSAEKLKGYLEAHKKALDQFEQAETSAEEATRARLERMAVGDEEHSDHERQHRPEQRPNRSEPRSSRKGKEREEDPTRRRRD